MNLRFAEGVANEFVKNISPFCKKLLVVGSIRRERPVVNDIDIVILPRDLYNLKRVLFRIGKIIKQGEKLIEIDYRREQVDLYVADENTFETLVLIRTGSMQHNIKLCSIAKGKGWKLRADGVGLVDNMGEIIANTEKEILIKLLGEYVEPKQRE